MAPSRWSRFGLIVLLAAVFGFVFAVAISAQRTARMHAVLGLGVEAERPGTPAWNDGMDDVAGDEDGDGEQETTPPQSAPDPAAPLADRKTVRPLRVAQREPESPLLASEDDPP